ncbi:DUF397 domain-containing protein [Streptomyces scopuliridis]|uniref:DUF397 domain-containing protein n=1 Tax=Streptomyces scopuliridis TaxID=452529 RepID=UPI0036CB98E3
MSDSKWLKSSYSEASGNNCVEVASNGRHSVALRDSTMPTQTVQVSPAAFDALIRYVAAELLIRREA